MGPIATPEEKRRVLHWLRDSDRKYRKPFEKGELNVANFLGGTCNDYAQVVFNMGIADTLVNIEEQLTTIATHLTSETANAEQYSYDGTAHSP